MSTSWWYFDTNCISELIKLYLNGYSQEVDKFLLRRDVLISSSVMQELRKAPNLLSTIPEIFQTANLFVIPDLTRFWYADFAIYQDKNSSIFNLLDLFRPPNGFFTGLLGHYSCKFEKACKQSEELVSEKFIDLIKSDIGADIDERDLCIIIWQKIVKLGKQWFGIEIPPFDSNAMNFPAFYVFYYVYFFKFIKNAFSKPVNNDFIDLANCLAAPYCERYYCEAKFAAVLRNEIKNRQPPTAFQLAKRLYKKGFVSQKDFEGIRKFKNKFEVTNSLLQTTDIFSFAELRKQIT